jgi:hypothetical protein
MSETITAWICPETLEGTIHLRDPNSAGTPEIDHANATVTVVIRPHVPPPGCQSDALGSVTVRLHPDPAPAVCRQPCGYAIEGDDDLIYWYWPEREDLVGAFEYYPEIVWHHPDHCHWHATRVRLRGPARCEPDGSLLAVAVPAGGGPIAERKSAPVPTETVQSQNTVVPGMRLDLVWDFHDGRRLTRLSVDAAFWCTACFTGGVIAAINGGYDTPELTYTVTIEGRAIICRPAAWVRWEVGDWVFVTIPSAICADRTRDWGECKGACLDGDDPPAVPIILPLSIGMDGA